MKIRQIVTFNIISLTIYFSFFIFVLNHFDLNELIFSSSDSKEYRDFGMWLLNHKNGYCSDVRPFLYPFISQLFFYLGGGIAIWFMQFLFYWISINLLFISLLKMTENSLLSFVGGLIFSSNFTFILMTMHGLTEVSVIFLLSVFVFNITLIFQEKLKFKNILIIVFLFSLLTVIKPVFSIFIWISLGILFLKFYKKVKYFSSLLLIVLSISPLLIQISIMKLNHNDFFISKIGDITLRDYYFRKLYADVNTIPFNISLGPNESDLKQIVKITDTASTNEIINYSLSHPYSSVKTYSEILFANINTHSEIINGLHFISFSKWMENVNTAYFYIHLLFLVLIILFVKKTFKSYGKKLWLLVSIYFISCFIILISGISFWQGDRLVLPAMPLWIYTYIFFTNLIYQMFVKKN